MRPQQTLLNYYIIIIIYIYIIFFNYYIIIILVLKHVPEDVPSLVLHIYYAKNDFCFVLLEL